MGTKPTKSRFVFTNEKVQDLFAAEMAEVREEVEAYHLKLKEKGDSKDDVESQNQRYQR